MGANTARQRLAVKSRQAQVEEADIRTKRQRGLPGFDGYALARSIRAHDEGRQIYLVALSGYGQLEDRLRSEEAGFDNHVVKPVDVDQLALLLQRANR